MIYFEFAMNMCINLVNSIHFLQLILIRGFNISIFTHFIIGRTAFNAVHKLYTDVSRFLKFREFMASLQKDFPLIRFQLREEEAPVNVNEEIKVVQSLEDCAICKEQMVTARKLQCGHVFH